MQLPSLVEAFRLAMRSARGFNKAAHALRLVRVSYSLDDKFVPHLPALILVTPCGNREAEDS